MHINSYQVYNHTLIPCVLQILTSANIQKDTHVKVNARTLLEVTNVTVHLASMIMVKKVVGDLMVS